MQEKKKKLGKKVSDFRFSLELKQQLLQGFHYSFENMKIENFSLPKNAVILKSH